MTASDTTSSEPGKATGGRQAFARPRPEDGARQTVFDLGYRLIGLGTFYVLVLLFFTFEAPHFFAISNARIVLASISVLGIVSLGQLFAIIGGGFDISVSGTLALGAVTYALWVNDGYGAVGAALLVVLVGVAVGVANGLFITRAGVNPLITTLATLSITSGVAFTLAHGLTITFVEKFNGSAGWLGARGVGDLENSVFFFAALALLAFVTLRFTVFGRSLYAVGGNRDAARLAGLRVSLLTVATYCLCGAAAALAGVVTSSELLAGSPSVGLTANLQSIAAVILGGAALTGGSGGVVGTVLGVLVLGTIINGMALMQVQSFYQQIATGFILLAGVAFARLREVARART